jgi:hypothetical protein
MESQLFLTVDRETLRAEAISPSLRPRVAEERSRFSAWVNPKIGG